MTPAGRRALAALVALADELVGTAKVPRGTVPAADVARTLWPDSPAWRKRPRRTDGRSGGLGATLPMLAGKVLSRLRDDGLASGSGHSGWSPTGAGRRALEGDKR